MGSRPTLGNLLALVDLGNFLIEELVTLLTDLDDLLALQAQSYKEILERMALREGGAQRTRDGLEHFVRNLGSGLVLGQGVRVVEGVV